MSKDKTLKETNRAFMERLRDFPQIEARVKSEQIQPILSTNKSPDNLSGLTNSNHLALIHEQQSASKAPVYNSIIDHIGSDSIAGKAKAESQTNQNDVENMVKPSLYLRDNVLPEIKEPFTIEYHLSLDLRNDSYSMENHIPEHSFHFAKFGNISKVELVSLLVSKHQILCDEPYIFLNIKEIPGRYHLSNGTRTFGKMLPCSQYSNSTLHKNGEQGNEDMIVNNDYIFYQPEECLQSFSKPINLEDLTLSFCNSNGLPINIREIRISKVIISKSEGLITVDCMENHLLKVGDKIEIIIRRPLEMESYDIDVVEIQNNRSFKIKNDFKDPPTHQTRIFKLNIHLSLTLRFSEINWFLLTDGNISTAQIIKLNQLLKEHN